jgi:hypothetical protein
MRITGGKRHCFPHVTSGNTLYSLCSMKSCVGMEWAVTLLFLTPELKQGEWLILVFWIL